MLYIHQGLFSIIGHNLPGQTVPRPINSEPVTHHCGSATITSKPSLGKAGQYVQSLAHHVSVSTGEERVH